MLRFFSVAEAHNLICPRPSDENFSFACKPSSPKHIRHVCYPNPKQDTPYLKSSICRKISSAAKTTLSVDITVKDLFESISSLSAPAPIKLFTFTSTKVNQVSKIIAKPSIVLKSITPPIKSTKAAPKEPITSK